MSIKDWRKCVLLGDSKEFIKRIPDNSIDLILTDPPYNIGKHSTGNIPLPGRSAMNNDVADWDWIDFNPEEWANDFIRILKPTGNLFIFTSYNQIGRWYDCLDDKFDTSNFMIWHKTNPAPKIYKAGFLNSCEMIFTCWNKKHTWNFISQTEMHNFIESPICMRPERISNPKHPAQKPVKILEKLITIASNPNDIVFDPFMGVGSVGVAALNLGRRYIGIDINPLYHDAAKQRINSAMDNSPFTIANEPAVVYGSNPSLIDISVLTEKQTPTEQAMPTQALRPILKWAGGKEKELKYILPNTPQEFQNYFEPFVGGGSVFTAIKANKYYINDLSDELITLYRNIKGKEQQFFNYANAIDTAWENAQRFFEQHNELTEIYSLYKQGGINNLELQTYISYFCKSKANEIIKILSPLEPLQTNVLLEETRKNLQRKLLRMRQLELQKHELPEEDIRDNIETAIKSALYMYFRHLYNDKDLKRYNRAFANALFLFIRNYAYSGMFRYNDKGIFNVPYGGIAYNRKRMEKKLRYYKSVCLHDHMENTTIENLDFEAFMRKHKPTTNDFVFLDPPYDSEFSTYAQNEFTHTDQKRLADYIINECPAKWMLVIKNTDFIYSLYADKPGITIRTFDKDYLVSFMNRNDKHVTHLLITNY